MYLLIFLYLIILYLFQEKLKNYLIVLCIVPIVILIWIRYGIGTDYHAYNYLFNKLDASSFGNIFDGTSEFGFNFLVYLSKKIGFSYHAFSSIFISTVLLIYVIWIKKNSSDFILSIIILFSWFFIVWLLSALRQGFVIAIGSLLFYSKDINLKPRDKMIVIFLLGTIHISAFIFVVLFALEKLSLDIKKHIIIFLSSVLFSLVFKYAIFPMFRLIPFIRNIGYIAYAGNEWEIFPAIIRIFFFTFVLLFYSKITSTFYTKKIVDIHLLGYSMYFLLKFSEIIAGRFFAYTFVLIVIIIPLVKNTFSNKTMKNMFAFVVFIFSFSYLIKDLNAYTVQSGYFGSNNFYTYQTIFNKNNNEFYNHYAFLVNYEEMKEKFINQSIDIDRGKVSLDGFVSVKEDNYYIILDQEGNRVSNFRFDYKPSIYGHVIEYSNDINALNQKQYFTVEGKNVLPTDAINFIWQYNLSEAELLNNSITYGNLKSNEIPPEVRKHFNTNINESMEWRFTYPSLHYLVEVDYFNNKYYMLLDSERKPMMDMFFKKIIPYNMNGIAELHIDDLIIYIDINGNVVWVG